MGTSESWGRRLTKRRRAECERLLCQPCASTSCRCQQMTYGKLLQPIRPLFVTVQGLAVSRPPFQRCQYMRISLISSPWVSQKMAPRASTHSPVRRRRNTHLNSVENQGPAAKISPEEKVISDWLNGTSSHHRRMASAPLIG